MYTAATFSPSTLPRSPGPCTLDRMAMPVPKTMAPATPCRALETMMARPLAAVAANAEVTA